MSELRKALVLQVSDSEREELEAFCRKYNFSSDKLIVALLKGLKSGKISLGHDEEGEWIVSSKGKEQKSELFGIQLLEKALSLINGFLPDDKELNENEEEIKEWSLTANIHTLQEPEKIPHDLVNILALAESGYELGLNYIDLKSIFDNEEEFEEEFEEATDNLYDLAKKVLYTKK